MERAVIAKIRGKKAADEIAEEHGLSREELESWEEIYKQAGLAALARLT